MLARFFNLDYKGVYVDVGAGYPVWYSNSVEFRSGGWKIISIEPQPQMCEEFRRMGFPVLQFACTNKDIGKTTFEWNTAVAGGMGGSALKWRGGDVGTENSIIEVEAYTLNTLLERFHPEIDHIDILDIDTEGWSFEVLQGFDINKYRPKIVMIENILSKVQETREYMKTAGYFLESSLEGENLEIYMRKERMVKLGLRYG